MLLMRGSCVSEVSFKYGTCHLNNWSNREIDIKKNFCSSN